MSQIFEDCSFLFGRGVTMKFVLWDGKYYEEKFLDFPVAKEFASSKLLVVCTENGKIVAVCGMRSLLNVLNLYVTEGYRGHGIGTQVLKKAMQAAKKRRLGFITLTVYEDNTVAFDLYRKFGFKEVLLLRKSRQILMIVPLKFTGKITYVFFRMIRLLIPNAFLSCVHSWLYRRTLVR